MKQLLLTLVFMYFSQGAFCQSRYFKEAEQKFEKGEYFAAIDLYKVSYVKVEKKLKPECIFKIAMCYYLIHDYKQAEIYFSKLHGHYPDPIVSLYAGGCLKYLGKYPEAIKAYKEYGKQISDEVWQDGVRSCELAVEWMNNPTGHKVTNMKKLNWRGDENSISFFGNNSSALLFSSSQPSKYDNIDCVIGNYIFINNDNGFVVDVDTLYDPVDSSVTGINRDTMWIHTPWDRMYGHVYQTNASADIKTGRVYFSRETWVGKPKKRVKVFRICAGDADARGAGVKVLNFLADSTNPYNFSTPFALSDNEILFSSDMPGGMGGYDLWRITYNEALKKWNAPDNLGPDVNTVFNEKFPFVHSDGSLYFSSDQVMSMGGYDIFKSARINKNRWAKPVNMQYPVNSSQDDEGIIFEANSENGYFTSNRPGGRGRFDIYRFELVK